MKSELKKPRRFLLGLILGGAHSALFLLVTIMVATSSYSLAGMAFFIFHIVDYPLAPIFDLVSDGFASVFFLGGLLWFALGWVLQSFSNIPSRHGLRWFVASLSLLAAILLLPELTLQSLPDWEEEWERGIAAMKAKDSDKAITYASHAIKLSPPDNPRLDGMWNHLGRLQHDRKNYAAAEQAFKAALAVIQSRPSSRPIDHLNAHNKLAWFYKWIKDVENEKAHLHKAIEFNRLVYGGDSTHEASCWKRLAEIEFASGNIPEALRWLDKAIAMKAVSKRPDDWLLNFMKDQRKEWATKPSQKEQQKDANPVRK